MPQTHSTSQASTDWFTLQVCGNPPTYWHADETGLISAKSLPAGWPKSSQSDNFKFSTPNNFFSIFSKLTNQFVGPGTPGTDPAETGFLYATSDEYNFTELGSNTNYTVFSFQVYYTSYVYCSDGKTVSYSLDYSDNSSPFTQFTPSSVS